jgi:hypothetical protein
MTREEMETPDLLSTWTITEPAPKDTEELTNPTRETLRTAFLTSVLCCPKAKKRII